MAGTPSNRTFAPLPVIVAAQANPFWRHDRCPRDGREGVVETRADAVPHRALGPGRGQDDPTARGGLATDLVPEPDPLTVCGRPREHGGGPEVHGPDGRRGRADRGRDAKGPPRP